METIDQIVRRIGLCNEVLVLRLSSSNDALCAKNLVLRNDILLGGDVGRRCDLLQLRAAMRSTRMVLTSSCNSAIFASKVDLSFQFFSLECGLPALGSNARDLRVEVFYLETHALQSIALGECLGQRSFQYPI